MLNTFFDKFIFTNALKYRHNNFFLVNIPFVIVPTELLVSFSAKENIELNKDIYYSVKDSTRKNLLRQFDLDFGLEGEKALNLVQDFFTASGWGGINRVDLDEQNKRAIVTVTNSPVASALHGKVKYEADHFLRGIFAGLFSGFFRTDVGCIETECIALGENKCKFIIKKLKEFDFSKKGVRRQIRLE